MALTPDHLRALDQLRQRLSQLSASLQSLQADLQRNEPLPTPVSLQQSAQMLAYNQTQVQEVLGNHRQFFKAAHSYPLPEFPGHAQEGLLIELMRKKMEPTAEAWVDRYNAAGEVDLDAAATDAIKDLWSWAGPKSNGLLREFIEDGVFDDDFTIAERDDGIEKVVTGLERKLGEDDDSEDEEGEKMEDVMPAKASNKKETTLLPVPMNKVLVFLSTGHS